MESTEQLLNKAITICAKKNIRFTPIRQLVFSLLAKQQTALSAYDLLELLKKQEPKAKPVTVYRVLEFLKQQGFVHRIELSNAYVLCHSFADCQSVQFLICNNCGQVKEIHSESLNNNFVTCASNENFKIERQAIEAYGLCHDCQ